MVSHVRFLVYFRLLCLSLRLISSFLGQGMATFSCWFRPMDTAPSWSLMSTCPLSDSTKGPSTPFRSSGPFTFIDRHYGATSVLQPPVTTPPVILI